jgi:ATP adenylyltransferase
MATWERSLTFAELQDFIQHRMRMSHVYQPVMLMTLLRGKGSASRSDIAKALLAQDQSQIEYYERITTNMVGRVLRDHNIVHYEKGTYSLNGFQDLTTAQINELVAACEDKLSDYIERRGQRIWAHRKNIGAPISGTIRYEVLKKARYRCELCGISADQKALEVDHIVPASRGGADDISNFQALCYSCNAMKRDRDTADFRGIRDSYKDREPSCPFCDPPSARVIADNELALALRDKFPVTDGHVLVIPRRHVASYFDLGRPEINACNFLLENLRRATLEEDETVTGFNIGINDGESAGRTIAHCHLHLIPRRKGDIEDPTGGVRGVIPNKRIY